jgi:hypothetical protein
LATPASPTSGPTALKTSMSTPGWFRDSQTTYAEGTGRETRWPLTRTLALQRLEGAAQRWLGPQAAYPSHTRARWNSRWSGDSVGLPAGQDGRFITPTPYVGAGMGHQVVTWCAGRVNPDVLGMQASRVG